MKIVNCILAFMMVLSFAQCSKEEHENETKIEVYQTIWQGTLTDSSGKEYYVMYSFGSESSGDFLYNTKKDEPFKDYNSFEYRLEGHILRISPIVPNNIFAGYWWITRYDGNNMTLLKEPDTVEQSIMTLKKVLQ